MIAFLRGQLAEALPTQVVIDVNGVGYEVLIPLSYVAGIPTTHEARLANVNLTFTTTPHQV